MPAQRLVSIGYLASTYRIGVATTREILATANVGPTMFLNGVDYYDESHLGNVENGIISFFRAESAEAEGQALAAEAGANAQ